MAGSAYTLSHAINKLTKHQSINLRSTTNYVNYPAFAGMRYYDMDSCRRMVYKSDVIIFHSAIRPFFTGLNLEKKELENKKKFIYFHGSELRYQGDALLKQVDEFLNDAKILVSTPDLLLYAPKTAKWLPVARSFSEISYYGICNQDRRAMESFAIPKTNIVFSHAITDEYKKGSQIFYKVITQAIKEMPSIHYQAIQGVSWDSCLRTLSEVDVYFDQAPPFVGSYGMLAVEASIFKIPVLCQLTTKVQDLIKKETGLDIPFISFRNEEDLFKQVCLLTMNEKLRKKEGQLGYEYCKVLHDEKPVVNRFLKIIEAM